MPKGTPLRRGEGLKARRAETIVFILTCLPNYSMNHSPQTPLCSAAGRGKTHREAHWVPSAWPESVLRTRHLLRKRQEPILQLKHMKLKCRPRLGASALISCCVWTPGLQPNHCRKSDSLGGCQAPPSDSKYLCSL